MMLRLVPVGGGGGSLETDAAEKVAKAHGASVYQVAIAWLLERSPVMLPIPGTSSVGHLEDNIGAAAIELTDDELEVLTNAV